MENLELIALEKDLEILQQRNYDKFQDQRFSEQLLRFFKRSHSRNTRNGIK